LALAIFGRLPLLPETLPALAYNPADLQMWARWLVTHLMYMVPGIVIGWLVGPWLNTALRAFYRIFNRGFEKTAHGYTWLVGRLVRFAVVVLIVYVVLASLTYYSFTRTPTGYVPSQDKGYLLVSVQLPEAASTQRTAVVMRQIDQIV